MSIRSVVLCAAAPVFVLACGASPGSPGLEREEAQSADLAVCPSCKPPLGPATSCGTLGAVCCIKVINDWPQNPVILHTCSDPSLMCTASDVCAVNPNPPPPCGGLDQACCSGSGVIPNFCNSAPTGLACDSNNKCTFSQVVAVSQPVWTPLADSSGVRSDAMWLMGDGTVLSLNSGNLSRLTPDATGSYQNGKWSPAGSLLLAKYDFASAVLSNGRLVTCGGEYSGPQAAQTETNFCEVYDPLYGTSTQLSPPPGWGAIGDSPTAVLPDGRVVLGNTQGLGTQTALLDPNLLTWTILQSGDGAIQPNGNNEQGYTLLQTGDVMTTDVYDTQSQRFNAAAGLWTVDAPVNDAAGSPIQLGDNSEIGPSMTLMDGRLVWFGGTSHSAIYTPTVAGKNGSWAPGPEFPVVNGLPLHADDEPAMLEPNGHVLVAASTDASSSRRFVQFVPESNAFALINNGPTGFASVRMLLLPNGHGLVNTDSAWRDVAFPASSGSPSPAWAPAIASFPSVVAAGQTVLLQGKQLAGLSECSTFGDDNQQAETYPTVRAVSASGAAFYMRAHDVSTRSIAPNQPGTVAVDIPASLPAGTYTAYAVAMGIPSGGVTFTVQAHYQGRAVNPRTFTNVRLVVDGKCLDLPNGSTANGTRLGLWDCKGTNDSNQRWSLAADGTIHSAVNYNKCIDLPDWETADTTPIQIFDCNFGSNQAWVYDADDTIRGYGGKCIDLPAGATFDGNPFQYYGCNGGMNQSFAAVP